MTLITEQEVAAALSELLAAQIRKSNDTPEDPEQMVRAYLRALRGLDTVGLEAAVNAIITEGKHKYLPTPAELATATRRSTPKPPEPGPSECGLPGCTCGGMGYYVSRTRMAGVNLKPMAQHLARHLGDRFAVRIEDARCPEPGCECRAVEVYLADSAGPPGRAYELTRLRPREWVWEHQAGQDGSQRVEGESSETE